MSEEQMDVVSEIDEKQLEGLRKQIEKKGEALTVRGDDVVGYWVPSKLPAYIIARTVKLFDGKQNKAKFSALIIAEAVDPTAVEYTKDGVIYQKLCKAGDTIGIWYKPGMRAIAMAGGVPAVVTETGEKKDVGKGNEMIVYNVRFDGGSLIPITSDTRDKSKAEKTPFDVPKANGGTSTSS